MNPAQELFTANVSKLRLIVLSQRNQLNAYLTNSIRQHHDAIKRILKNARNNAQLSAHHHKTVLHFSCFFFFILRLTNFIFTSFLSSIAYIGFYVKKKATEIFIFFIIFQCENVKNW